MLMIYGSTAIISLLILMIYWITAGKKEVEILFIQISVFFVNLGYFLLAISKTLQGALWSNRLSYLGAVCLPLCMLFSIMKLCHIKMNKFARGALMIISTLIFFVAASGGYLDLYYKKVSLETVHGATQLVKEYGPLHFTYYLYLFSFLGIMMGIIMYSQIKKKEITHKLAVCLLIMVCSNIGIWLIEQHIKTDFEFLSISYIFTEIMLIAIYSLIDEQELLRQQYVAQEEAVLEPAESVADIMPMTEESKAESVEEEEIMEAPQNNFIFSFPKIETLTTREMEVFEMILENRKRKDIAAALNVSENTVKKHTSHIFSKLEISSRKELFDKIKS